MSRLDKHHEMEKESYQIPKSVWLYFSLFSGSFNTCQASWMSANIYRSNNQHFIFQYSLDFIQIHHHIYQDDIEVPICNKLSLCHSGCYQNRHSESDNSSSLKNCRKKNMDNWVFLSLSSFRFHYCSFFTHSYTQEGQINVTIEEIIDIIE